MDDGRGVRPVRATVRAMTSYTVDPDGLLRAGSALAGAARLAHDGRRTAAAATAGDGWALDGPLPDALDRFSATLDAALGAVVDDAREASAALALAAQRYADAERAATNGASRDASGPRTG